MPVFHYELSMEIKRFYIFKMSGCFVMTGRFKCKCLTKIKGLSLSISHEFFLILCCSIFKHVVLLFHH